MKRKLKNFTNSKSFELKELMAIKGGTAPIDSGCDTQACNTIACESRSCTLNTCNSQACATKMEKHAL